MASIAVVLFGYPKHTFLYYTPLALCYSIADSSWGGVSWHKLLDCIHLLLFPIPVSVFSIFVSFDLVWFLWEILPALNGFG